MGGQLWNRCLFGVKCVRFMASVLAISSMGCLEGHPANSFHCTRVAAVVETHVIHNR